MNATNNPYARTITIPADLQLAGIGSWSWSPDYLEKRAARLREKEGDQEVIADLLDGLAACIRAQASPPAKEDKSWMSRKMVMVPVDLWANWSPSDLRCPLEHLDPDSLRALLKNLSDVVEAAYPAKMDEPEWGKSIEAHTLGNTKRRMFVRFRTTSRYRWSDEHGSTYDWSELVDPKPDPRVTRFAS